MGFYDYRCHATGLSLRPEKAVAVLLVEESKGTWTPASLPLFGQYNRLGTIDRVELDFHSALLAENFAAAVDSKRITLKGSAAEAWKEPPEDFDGKPFTGIDLALHVVERATTLASSNLKLSSRSLNHVLFHAGFFRAALAALAQPEPDLSTGVLLERAFPFEPARWLLRDLPEMTVERPQIRAALHSFHAWSQFLAPRVPWAPSQGMGQHGVAETVEGFATARARFCDVPWAMAALDAAMLQAEAETDELPAGWLKNAERSWYGLIIDGRRMVASSPARLRDLLTESMDDALFDPQPALFAVTGGRVSQSLDLRAVLRVKAGAKLEKLATPAGEDLSLEDGAEAVFNWDELASVLPPLEGTVLPGGAPAMVRIAEPRPSWLTKDEKYVDVLHFDE